jgi:AraC-like DNA-binding protein
VKPQLLWFDCTSGVPEPELRVRCASVFEVSQATSVDQAAIELARLKPAALIFDFDYPDQNRLHAMQAIKQSHARLPILMLTLEHSEMLAVWAFRARVWNYLVKPVSPAEFSENLDALANIGSRASPPRVAQLLNAAVPSELRVQPIAPGVARLQPALHHVKQHYHEKMSANAAARECGLSRFEFSRKFRAAFGMTFREYLLRVRITEARRLLTAGGDSVTAVGYSVGFNDGSHFARMFRRYTGMLPSEYEASVLLPQVDAVRSGRPPQPTFRRRATDTPHSAGTAT